MNIKDLLEDSLFSLLQSCNTTSTLWIAYSGGIDSTVLLHTLANIKSKLPNKVAAIHVNHKLNECSNDWQSHCEKKCNDLDMLLEVIDINKNLGNGESIEAWAREQRYEGFSNICNNDDYVLTAQHQDDQAETFLLQLMRGSGLEGLSAMPSIKKKYNYVLLRPFLDVQRNQIEQYAYEQKVKWIEDISNNDERFDRNFIRRKVLPLIKTRWPSASKTISRSSSLIAEAANYLQTHCHEILKSITCDRDVIKIEQLKHYSCFEQKYILRAWIKENHFILPSEAILEQILNNIINYQEDKIPLVHWQNIDVRRYKNKLYIMESLQAIESHRANWNLMNRLELDYGSLVASLEIGKGINKELIKNNTVRIQFRKGGEAIQPYKRNNKHELKKLFQEAEVLPWVRDKIPLIYVDDELVSVPGFWVSNKFACSPKQEGWEIKWNANLRLTT